MTGKSKNGTKPFFEPTDDERKTVSLMCAVGVPQEGIALVIRDGIDKKTLRKHFRSELDTAMIKANAKVGGSLFNKAISGDTASAIWWSKARMGWKESSDLNVAGGLTVVISGKDAGTL
tara:strand:- start:6191 stop:6547 length:357 start_codon:yes stop_codon:yes gene_type:complete